MRSRSAMLGLALLIAAGAMARAQDTRELVRLPEHMQAHMLADMRDHLLALNGIIGDVADDKFDDAAKLAEQRLGMSSLSLHDAAHLAPFMPKTDAGHGHRHAPRGKPPGDRAARRIVDANGQVDAGRRPRFVCGHLGLHELSRSLSYPLTGAVYSGDAPPPGAMTITLAPSATWASGATAISATTPSIGAVNVCSIFMASMMARR
jgi:hypothetical protein